MIRIMNVLSRVHWSRELELAAELRLQTRQVVSFFFKRIIFYFERPNDYRVRRRESARLSIHRD